MIGKDKLFTLIEKVMAQSKADQTEAVFVGSSTGLTRFANSFIHQNVAETENKVYFRAAVGKKLGVASTTSMNVARFTETTTALPQNRHTTRRVSISASPVSRPSRSAPHWRPCTSQGH